MKQHLQSLRAIRRLDSILSDHTKQIGFLLSQTPTDFSRSRDALHFFLRRLQEKKRKRRTDLLISLRILLFSAHQYKHSLLDSRITLQRLAEPMCFGYLGELNAAIHCVNMLIRNRGDQYALARVDVPLSRSIRGIASNSPAARIPSKVKLCDMFNTALILISASKTILPHMGEQVLELSGGEVKIPNGGHVSIRALHVSNSLVVVISNIGKVQVRVKSVEITGAAPCNTDILIPSTGFIARVMKRFPSMAIQSASLVGIGIDKGWAVVKIC